MNDSITLQGRELSQHELLWISKLIEDHPEWGRSRLSVHIAEQWHWRNQAGRLKDIAARTMLRKLAARGLIELPPRKSGAPHSKQARRKIEAVPHVSDPIEASLAELRPVQLKLVSTREQRELFAYLLHAYHYLSYSRPVGENLCYLIVDRLERPLGCLLFGAAAWKVADRDDYIGWDALQRQRHLSLVANNMRFLILPWVRVRHLASHVLGSAARSLSAHWVAKYGHPIYLLETFVDSERFAGTSYAAANWTKVGQTTGRSRNDRNHRLQVPLKSIHCYALCRRFRHHLTAPSVR
jgi:hypothetical protein